MNNRDQNSHGGTGNDPRHLTKDEMREKIKASLAAKEASEFHPETPKSTSQRFSRTRRTAAHPAIPPQSAAAPKKPGRSGMPFLPHTAANPRRHPAAPDSPGTTNPVKFPQRRQQPRQSNVAVAERPALFRPGTMKKSGKSVTEAVSPSLPASQCWQSCC